MLSLKNRFNCFHAPLDQGASGANKTESGNGNAKKPSRAEKKATKKLKRQNRTKTQKVISLVALIASAALVLTLAVVAFNYFDVIFNRPSDAFPTPKPIDLFPGVNTPIPDYTPDPDASQGEIVDLIARLDAEADKSIMTDGILNILIIGVDYADERVSEEWDGKQSFHADVMLVLAINFNEGTADLISLPRDTYAKIPGVEGIYKLNASLDCGGGMTPSGYEKVCEAAEWMLGGINVDYYYAVTMPVVKRLGNVVGGVDYDVEMDFTMAGRSYKAGMQHLDGQGILDYLRVRKGVNESGDLNRVNRQKRMLVALFNAMKKSNKLPLIPEIISAFGEDIATNTTLQQTMALALWALDLKTDNIHMYSMGGNVNTIFGWLFCLTDQQNRVNIIRQVYGVEVDPYLSYTRDYAHFRWQGMLYQQALKTSDGMLEEIEAILGEYLPTFTPEPTETPVPTETPTLDPSASPTPSPTPTPTPSPTPEFTLDPSMSPSPTDEPTPSPTPEIPFSQDQLDAYVWFYTKYTMLIEAYEETLVQAERFLKGQENNLRQSVDDFMSAQLNYRMSAENANRMFGLRRTFVWDYQYWLDPEFNEIMVDFR